MATYTSFEAVYNPVFDDYGTVKSNSIIPETRNQNPYGTCWAQATTAVAEIGQNKKGNNSPNLSETHLAYFMYNTPKDPLNLTAGDRTYISQESLDAGVNCLNIGGSTLRTADMLAGWVGIAPEEGTLEYSRAAGVVQFGLPEEYAYDADIYYLKSYQQINTADRDEIKNAIMTYGAVAASYYDDAGGMNAEETKFHKNTSDNTDASYYCPLENTTNHAITIVGWDDNYNNFNTTKGAPDDSGAWLIRNSWTTDVKYNQSSYFWMSYYDKSLSGIIAMDFEPVSNCDYDNNYHYDGGCYSSTYKPGYKLDNNEFHPREIQIANVFVSKENVNEQLKAVAFQTVQSNTNYVIDIYKNLTDLGDPLSGELVTIDDSIKRGLAVHSGYYTVDLVAPVELNRGEKFSVVITLSHPDDSPVEYGTEISVENRSDVRSKEHESYYRIRRNDSYSTDYMSWNVVENGNLRIKALTKNVSFDNVDDDDLKIATPAYKYQDLTIGESVELKVALAKDGTEQLGSGFSWGSSNPAVATVDDNGNVTAVSGGETDITATSKSRSKSITARVKVTHLSMVENIKCDVPVVVNKSYDDVKVTWDPVPGASSYKVILIYPNKAGKSNVEGETIGTEYTFDTAELYTEPKSLYYHYVDVIAYSDENCSGISSFGAAREQFLVQSLYTPEIIYINSEDPNESTKELCREQIRIRYGALYIPAIEGYSIDNIWYTNAEFTQGYPNDHIEDYFPYGSSPLYVKCTANTYTIEYNANGGTGTMSSSGSIKYNQSFTLPECGFTNSRHTFTGWNTEADGSGTPYDDKAAVSGLTPEDGGTVTLYAQWQVESSAKRNIIYHLYSGTNAPSNPSYYIYVDGSTETITLADPSKTGYEFFGWYTDQGFSEGSKVTFIPISANQDWNLYAQWEPNQYTVSFDSNGGGTANPASKSVTYGRSYEELSDCTRTGYTFAGWFTAADSGTQITKDSDVTNTDNHTLYAHWTGINYSVKFDANGGSGSMAALSMTYGVSQTLTKNTFTKTGYKFDGWILDSAGTTAAYSDEQSVRDLTAEQGGEVPLYVKWTPITYKILYNKNHADATGTMSDTEMVYDQSAPLRQNAFTRTGYIFAGWTINTEGTGKLYADKEEVNNLTTTDEDTITLYAKWEENRLGETKYIITYMLDGGTNNAENPSGYYAGSANITLKPATKTGYVFTGWFDAETDGNKITQIDTSTPSDVTVYARWRKIAYTVAYNSNGGTGTMENSSMTYGVPAALRRNEFVKTGYNFAGWDTNADGTGTSYSDGQSVTNLTEIDEATVNLYAQWSVKNITVSFSSEDGAVYTPITVVYGGTYGTLPSPSSRTGYTFAGWYTEEQDGTEVTAATTVTEEADHTLYAHWTAHTYTIAFDANTGSGTMSPMTMTYGVPAALTSNTFTKEGYAFAGWNTEADGSGTAYEDNETVSDLADGVTVTLYAQWSEFVTVTFDSNGGSDISPITVFKDGAYGTLPIPTRTGYTFAGWFTHMTGGTQVYATSIVTADITLYAHWFPIIYTVAYNANGGNGIMSSTTMTYGTPAALSENKFTWFGHTFTGWNTEADGRGTPYRDNQLVSNLTATSGATITLYAQWKSNGSDPAIVTINFNSNGGSAVESKTVRQGDAYGLLPVPEREGFTFKGWYTAIIGGSPVTAASIVDATGEITLYAMWSSAGDYSNYDEEDRQDISGCTFGKVKSKVYDGKPYCPTPAVYIDVNGKSKKLVLGTDYRLTYDDNINAGLGTITVHGIGNCVGEKSARFVISRKKISSLTRTASSIVAGNTLATPISVFDGSYKLIKGKDFDYTMPSTDKKGNVKVTIKALSNSNYTGETTVSVPVIGDDDARVLISKTNISVSPSSVTYDGKAKKPEVTITYRGSTLINKKNYSISYKNNTNAGTAYIVIKAKGQVYAGSVIVPFEITPYESGFSSIVVNKNKSLTYTGKLQKPSVVVMAGKKKLSSKKDYIVEYEDNLLAGFGTATIIGTGNYAGLIGYSNFPIEPRHIKKASFKIKNSENYVLKYNGRELIEGYDYDVVVTEAPKNKVNLTFYGTGNFGEAVTKKNIKKP